MSAIVVTSDRFADHLMPPGHSERVERAEVMQVVASRWAERGGRVIEPRSATREEVGRVHASGYIDAIAATAGRATMLDPDTYTSPESYDVALLAAGAAIVATDTVLGVRRLPLDTSRLRAFALVRPPGHHAERDRAMGFCLFNNIAVAAAQALSLGIDRIAIVDYDVHHGNGTQWTFYEDPRVLYISTHQYPFYPGTGAAGEAGAGSGEGFTVNVPLRAGATDGDYDLVFRSVIVPVLHEFKPQLLLVSAGFDGHERDPLAGMRLSTAGYAVLNRHLSAVADATCQGRMVLVLEGGYALHTLAECLETTLEILDEERPSSPPSAARAPEEVGGGEGAGAIGAPTDRGPEAVELVRAVQKPYWRAL